MYNILVCDDEKDIVEALGIYLSAEGYQVTKAYNGQEACEKLKTEDVQLVLMDIMMPVMDGWEVCRKLRAKDNTPVRLPMFRSFCSQRKVKIQIRFSVFPSVPTTILPNHLTRLL